MKRDILVLAGIGAGIAALYFAGSGSGSLDYGGGGGGGAPVFGKLVGTPEPAPVMVYQFPPQPEVNFPTPQLWSPQTVLTPQVAQNRKKEAMKEVTKAVLPAPVKAVVTAAELKKDKFRYEGVKQGSFAGYQYIRSEVHKKHTMATAAKPIGYQKGMSKKPKVSTKKAEKMGLIKFDQPVKKKKRHTSGHHHVSSSSYAYHYKHHVGKPSPKKVWVAM